MMKRLIKNFPLRQIKKAFSTKITTDSFMNGVSSLYIEQMFKLWKDDKKSVHNSWDQYFTNLQNGVDYNQAYQAPPNLVGCKILSLPSLFRYKPVTFN
jgi:2-oxoglutarate dehydrogenase E1 component